MTPPFPEICKKDLCRDGIYYAKGSYFRIFLGFMQGGGGEREGGGAGPTPTFSSSRHFSSIHILNIDLSLGYPPPPQLLWEQVTNGS